MLQRSEGKVQSGLVEGNQGGSWDKGEIFKGSLVWGCILEGGFPKAFSQLPLLRCMGS